jgi:hypothetical protein
VPTSTTGTTSTTSTTGRTGTTGTTSTIGTTGPARTPVTAATTSTAATSNLPPPTNAQPSAQPAHSAAKTEPYGTPIGVQSLTAGEYIGKPDRLYVGEGHNVHRNHGTLAFTINAGGDISGLWVNGHGEVYRVSGWRGDRAREALAVLRSDDGSVKGSIVLTRYNGILQALVNESDDISGRRPYQGPLTRPNNDTLPAHATFNVRATNRSCYWPWHSNRRLQDASSKLLAEPMTITESGQNEWTLTSTADQRIRIEVHLRRADAHHGYQATIRVREQLPNGGPGGAAHQETVTFHGGCLVTRRDPNTLRFTLFGADKQTHLWLEANIHDPLQGAGGDNAGGAAS